MKRMDFWWDAPEGQVHDAIVETVRLLDEQYSSHRSLDFRNARLYGQQYFSSYLRDISLLPRSRSGMRVNLVRSIIDTATAHIATVRPRPMFLTQRGSPMLEKRARNLNKFVMGQFYAHKQYINSLNTFRDACIFGTGAVKISDLNGQIRVKRVMSGEALVDEADARDGHPTYMVYETEVSRRGFMAAYPEHAEAIKASDVVRDRSRRSHLHRYSDQTSYMEAWRLPTSSDADDGRHVICANNVTIVDKPWTQDTYPICFFRWSEPTEGFWGSGLCDDLKDIQHGINYLLTKIQELMRLASTQVVAPEGTVNPAHLTNRNMGLLTYRGQTPPMFKPVQSVSQEYFAHIDRLKAWGYEIAGVTQLAATGRKPEGLNSGRALLEYQDVQSQRFQDVQQRWEQHHLDIAHELICAARRIDQEGDGGFKIMARDDKSLEELNFSEVHLEEDQYQMQVFPTSFLPATPAGKLQMLQDLGQISPEIRDVMLDELDFPDTEKAISLATAPLKLVDQRLEYLMTHEPIEEAYWPPDQFMNLELAMRRGQLYLNRAQVDGYPEDRLELLRQWLDDAEAMVQPPAPPPGAPPAAGPPAGAPPGAPPVPPQAAALAGGGVA